MVDNWVVIGRFGKVHGIQGNILVHSFTEPFENILNYQPWYIKLKNQWCPIKVTFDTDRHADKILVQVENYPSREDVSKLTNFDIAIPRDQLPELNEDNFYLHDLIGLNVFDELNQPLGQIEDLLSNGAQDIIVIKGTKRILIPFIWDVFIKSVDLTNKTVIVHWEE